MLQMNEQFELALINQSNLLDTSNMKTIQVVNVDQIARDAVVASFELNAGHYASSNYAVGDTKKDLSLFDQAN